MTTVSVIIPTYNCAKYISEAVESVLNQTFRDFEIIIVDDGSTDNTRDVLAGYYERIRYFYQENKGPGAARNRGVKESKGEFVSFLDSDDFYMSNSLEKGMQAFKKYPFIGLAFSDYYLFDNGKSNYGAPYLVKKDFLNKFRNSIEKRERGFVLLNSTFFKESVVKNQFIHTDTVIVKKKVMEELGGFAENLRAGEDLLMWYKISKAQRICYIDMPLSCYNRYRGYLTRNELTLYMESIYFLKSLLRLSDNDKNSCRAVKKRISNFCYWLGDYYIANKLWSLGIKTYANGIAYDAVNLNNWRELVKSIFAPKQIRKLFKTYA